MIGCLFTFLIFVLVVVIVAWIVRAGLEAMGTSIPGNIQHIVMLILALLALLMFLQCAFGGGGDVSFPAIFGRRP